MNQLTYLQGYPEHLLTQVRSLIAEQKLGAVLEKRYPGTHDFATDKALWQYTQDLKSRYLKSAPPINKVMYDNPRAGRQAEGEGRNPRRDGFP